MGTYLDAPEEPPEGSKRITGSRVRTWGVPDLSASMSGSTESGVETGTASWNSRAVRIFEKPGTRLDWVVPLVARRIRASSWRW